MEDFVFVHLYFSLVHFTSVPANMINVNSRNTRTRCERCSGVFIANFEHVSHLPLVFLLLNLNN